MRTKIKQGVFRLFLFVFAGVFFLSSCKKTENPYQVITGVLPGDTVYAIAIDQQGIKWFGTDGGLVSFNGDKWRTYTAEEGLAEGTVHDLALQKTVYGSEVWVATGEGASVCAYDVDGITAATTYNSGSAPLGDTVIAVAVDTGQVRWFGTSAGISIFYDHGVWQSLSYAAAGHKEVTCIGSAPDGWNYMGTRGSGVARYVYDKVDGITGASLYQQPWSPLPSQEVLSVFVDDEGDQWYGTREGAAFHTGTDAKKGWVLYTVKDGLVNNTVLSVSKTIRERCGLEQ